MSRTHAYTYLVTIRTNSITRWNATTYKRWNGIRSSGKRMECTEVEGRGVCTRWKLFSKRNIRCRLTLCMHVYVMCVRRDISPIAFLFQIPSWLTFQVNRALKRLDIAGVLISRWYIPLIARITRKYCLGTHRVYPLYSDIRTAGD